MRFEEVDEGWTEKRLTQINAAQLPGVCPTLFAAPSTPRQARGPPLGRLGDHRYEEDGLDGLIDKRLARASRRRAPVDEVMRLAGRCIDTIQNPVTFYEQAM